MKQFFLMTVCSLLVMAGVHARQDEEATVRKLLAQQVVRWNEGSLEGYMIGYWESDSLVFIGKNGPTYGYQATLARYRKSYPTRGEMGKLTSTIISLQRLSPDYFLVMGRWELARTGGDLKGSYTLLLKKISGNWVIIHDHSS